MQHFLSSQDISKAEILKFFKKADSFLKVVKDKKKLKLAEGKILATLFYEPSTRTRFSFETAMLRLGGSVISNADMSSTSSSKKGETLYDTAKMVSTFADIIVMRHPNVGSVSDFASGSSVPVINGGDGAGDHPSQGLLDLYTIYKNCGHINGLTIGMVGDLKNSRVLHSQCWLLSHFSDLKFIFVGPKGLEMPENILIMLKNKGHQLEFTHNLQEKIQEFDVMSHTRIQKERFVREQDYLKYKGIYLANRDLFKKAKKKMILIHPLPRVDEIALELDTDPRSKYFEQIHNGVAIRMAIISHLLRL